jgi:peptidoglycan/xylan/chitin deacetylase (PgdA/CDA1 family)
MIQEHSSFRAPPLPLVGRSPRGATLESTLLGRGKRGVRALAEAIVPTSLVVWRGPTSTKSPTGAGRISLTFDDGPTSLTRDYLAVLERFGARATFFLVGDLCARHPELVAAIARGGHEIAGHGYTHRRFPELSARDLAEELERTRRLLPPDGRRRSFVRPPHGTISVGSTLTTASAGFTTVLWSYDSGDWATEAADQVAARFVERPVQAGEIILLHEGQTWTLDALPRILTTLTEAGHEMVTTGELLGR